MIGGLLKSASRLALIATAGVLAGGVAAQAADLGGNCCADLEERVAELEATTARKGNRKVSLQVYGQISEAIMVWDDGNRRDTYVVENKDRNNTIGFQGTAKINADWSAGYKIEYEVRAYRSDTTTQVGAGNNSAFPTTSTAMNTQSLSLRHAYWSLTSNTYGTVSVGQQAVSASGIYDINLATPDGFADGGAGYLINAMLVRTSTMPKGSGATGYPGTLAWKNLFDRFGDGPNSFDATRTTTIRYITPAVAGFQLSADWGESDIWDVALRYAGEFSGFRVAAGASYTGETDNDRGQCAAADNSSVSSSLTTPEHCNTVQLGGSIMHVATGLYVSGGFGRIKDEERQNAWSAYSGNNNYQVKNTDTSWLAQVGWQAKLNSLGNTTFWTEYQKQDNGLGISSNTITSMGTAGQATFFSPSATSATAIAGTKVTAWGLGVTQAIDAAAMNLYLGYFNFSSEMTLVNKGASTSYNANSLSDMNVFYSGATIKF